MPRFADVPVAVFDTAADVVAYCVTRPAEPHGLYWRSRAAGDPTHGMVFFTTDGGLILDLSVNEGPDRWRDELLQAVGGTAGCIAHETPPPDTARGFLAWATGGG